MGRLGFPSDWNPNAEAVRCKARPRRGSIRPELRAGASVGRSRRRPTVGRAAQPDLEPDVICSPSTPPPQLHHPLSQPLRRPVRRPMRPRRPITQTSVTLQQPPVTPFTHRLGVDLKPLRGRLHRPTGLDHTPHHPPPTLHRQRGIRVLRSSVSHEPSLRAVCLSTHSLVRRAHPIPPRTTSPVITARAVSPRRHPWWSNRLDEQAGMGTGAHCTDRPGNRPPGIGPDVPVGRGPPGPTHSVRPV